MGDVLVTYDQLTELNDSLKNIIEELKNASNRADELEAAIGDPYGRNDLREAAEEFEDGWDDRRNKLREDIEKVQQHVEGVVKGFEEWDTDTSSQMG